MGIRIEILKHQKNIFTGYFQNKTVVFSIINIEHMFNNEDNTMLTRNNGIYSDPRESGP